MARVADRLPRPPYDPEIEPIVQAAAAAATEQYESFEESFDLERLREEALKRESPRTEALLRDRRVTCEDLVVPGPRNNKLTLTVVRPAAAAADRNISNSNNRPCIFYVHGGAMVRSNRHAGLDTSVVWAAELGATTVSVEYGLAPENPGTGPAEDCYAALRWVRQNPSSLGIDAARIILYGVSAGGGLAAAVALMVRDRDGKGNGGGDGTPLPKLCGLFLKAPMLDDRNTSVSAQQYVTGPMYNSTINRMAWRCLLGERAGTTTTTTTTTTSSKAKTTATTTTTITELVEGQEEGGEEAVVSAYEAPARAADLSGLPPTYVDCGTADPFRDDAAAFASKLWAGGVAAEFHAWPGGPHAFDRIAPEAAVSVLAKSTRLAWMRRILGIPATTGAVADAGGSAGDRAANAGTREGDRASQTLQEQEQERKKQQQQQIENGGKVGEQTIE
ncbi:hypothetical protein SLS62_005983 [Diatrype stigma]|uniref:Alpha/beta hydrolase fold-3 domain-containing protein n=1 Tax=Diatrype stigma TaxID=117547 RepID=A0AAN9UQ67_9PEZI